MLPYATDYDPYTLEHVVTQLQLLIFSALAFTVLMRTGIYPPELRSTNLDTDWLWRRPGAWIGRQMEEGSVRFRDHLGDRTLVRAERLGERLVRSRATDQLTRTRPSGSMAFWMTVMLLAFLMLALF